MHKDGLLHDCRGEVRHGRRRRSGVVVPLTTGAIIAIMLMAGCDPGISHSTREAQPTSRPRIQTAQTPDTTLTAVLANASTATPSQPADRSVSVFPDRGPIGISGKVTGRGFPANAELTITLANLDTHDGGAVGTARTDATGNFGLTVTFAHYLNGLPIAPGVFALGLSSSGSSLGPSAILQLNAALARAQPSATARTRPTLTLVIGRPPAPPATPVIGGPTVGLPVTPASRVPPVLGAIVAQDAHVRDRPGGSGSHVLDVLVAGETVLLRQQTPGGAWFLVLTGRGQFGWVKADLLTIDPSVASVVPSGSVEAGVTRSAATPTVPLPPAAKQPVSLTIGSSTTYTSTAVIVVVGEALNGSAYDLEEVQVSAALIGAQGSVVDRTAGNLIDLQSVPAGGRVPFMLWFANPPSSGTHVAVEVHGNRIASDAGGGAPYFQLLPRMNKPEGQPDGLGFTVAGRITNTGRQTAEDVVVAVIAYDARGQVVDVGAVPLDSSRLDAGTAGDFTVHLATARARPAHYSVLAAGVVGINLDSSGG